MFCNQCGSPLEEGTLFCASCGAKQDVAEASATTPVAAEPVTAVPVVNDAPAEPKKKFDLMANKKLFMFGGAGLVVVLLVVLLFMFIGGGSSVKYDKYADLMVDYLNFDGDGHLFTTNGDMAELDDVVYDGDTSADQSRIAFTIREDGVQVLYYADTDMDPKFVEEDVYEFAISYDGSHIAYIQDMNAEWTAGDLYLYSIEDDKAVKVDTDVYPYDIVMSPNGEYVAYWKDYEGYSDNDLVLGCYSKESEKIDKDGSYPVGITNDGKLYYITDNGKLYYHNGKEAVKIASDMDGTCYFNNDLTELLYTKSGKTYYFTPKMKEALKISGDYTYDILAPENMIYEYYGDAYVLGRESLKNSVWETYDGLMWFNENGKEMSKITSYYGDCQISEDGKTLIFTRDGVLFKVDDFTGKSKPEALYNDDYIDGIVANGDLSKIYVVIDDELYYVKNAKKSERITNDLEDGTYSVVYSNSLDKVVFIEDDTLCYADTSEKSKKEIEEEVYDIESSYGVVIYSIYDEDNYEYTYYLFNGEKSIELYTY